MKPYRLWLYRLVSKLLPPTRCFGFKNGFLRWCGVKVGNNVRIVSDALFMGNGHVAIGNDVWIGSEVAFHASGDATIEIGSCVDIAPRVIFVTGAHAVDVKGNHMAGKGYNKSIQIGAGSWIGTSSVILNGVRLPPKTLVAAGSVVTHSVVGEGSLLAGVPASVKKTYV